MIDLVKPLYWSCESCAINSRACHIKDCKLDFKPDQLIYPSFENPFRLQYKSDKGKRLKNQLKNLENLKQQLIDQKEKLENKNLA